MALKDQKSQDKQIIDAMLMQLAEIGGAKFGDDDITWEGTKLIIPETMTISETIKFLVEKQKEDEKVTNYSRVMRYRPWDGAYCAYQAMKEAFGAVGHKSSPGFWGPNPPQLITLTTDFGKQEQVPWGDFDLPLMPGVLFTTGMEMDDEFGPLFKFSASGPKKWRHHIEGVFRLVENELERNSMYRGKAFDGRDQPDFLDLSAVDRQRVVYSEEVQAQLAANVWSPIRYTEAEQELGLPLKRAVLIEGPYGTGKTLAAFLTAKEAHARGWTFIMARPGRDDLSYVMQTARLYQPAVVFFEDMDQIANPDTTEGDQITKLLDLFDGIQAKGTKIVCILTTNHKERIHKGMVRPGRLDAVISIGPLDAPGIETLIRANVAEHLIDDNIDFGPICASMEEISIPAFVREAADRAVRYGMSRTGGELAGLKLTTEDFVHASEGLKPQLEMMQGAKDQADRDPLGVEVQRVAQIAAKDAVIEVIHPKFINPEALKNGNG